MDRRISALGDALASYFSATERTQLTDAKRLSGEALLAEQAVADALTALQELADDRRVGLPLLAVNEVAGALTLPEALPRTHAVRERDGEHTSWIEIWNRPAEAWRIWNADGQTFHCVDDGPHRSRVERLYFDPNVSVAISQGARMDLRWIDRSERTQAWLDEIEARTYDPAWRPPSGAPGTLHFVPLEFSRLDVPLLVLHDFD